LGNLIHVAEENARSKDAMIFEVYLNMPGNQRLPEKIDLGSRANTLATGFNEIIKTG